MKRFYLYIVLMAGLGTCVSSCADFLDREPLTVPNNE